MTTGFREYRNGTPYLVFHRTYTAPIQDVWDSIADPERMRRWFGTWTGDPSTGKVALQWTAEQDSPTETYVIEACDAPRHLRLHTDTDDPAKLWTLDLSLTESDGETTLSFAQLVDDPSMVTDVGPGWQYYLDRLEVARSGGDADSVNWEDYLKYGPDYAREFELNAADGEDPGSSPG